MKYLKYFENNNIEQQPFYISNNTLYISDSLAVELTPTYNDLKKRYHNNPDFADLINKKNIDFFNRERDEKGYIKSREIHTNIKVRWRNMYSMNIIIKYRGNCLENEFGKFNYYITGNSGDSEMHGKNMKRATDECNYHLIIKLYPIVEHIKNFMRIFKSKEYGFLDIIKKSLDKDIMLAKYGIPKELEHLYKGVEDSIKNSIKYNI